MTATSMIYSNQPTQLNSTQLNSTQLNSTQLNSTQPTRPDPTRPDPTRPDPTRPDPTRLDSTQTKPNQTNRTFSTWNNFGAPKYLKLDVGETFAVEEPVLNRRNRQFDVEELE
jgi:hypothetical protein